MKRLPIKHAMIKRTYDLACLYIWDIRQRRKETRAKCIGEADHTNRNRRDEVVENSSNRDDVRRKCFVMALILVASISRER